MSKSEKRKFYDFFFEAYSKEALAVSIQVVLWVRRSSGQAIATIIGPNTAEIVKYSYIQDFEKIDLEGRIQRILEDFFNQRTPGTITDIPGFEQILSPGNAKSWIENEFYDGPGMPRKDSFSMRRLISEIDETIKMRKAGSITGQWKMKMYKHQQTVENDLIKRYNATKREDPDASGLYDEKLGYLPINLHVALLKDNRRILRSVLGDINSGIDMKSLVF